MKKNNQKRSVIALVVAVTAAIAICGWMVYNDFVAKDDEQTTDPTTQDAGHAETDADESKESGDVSAELPAEEKTDKTETAYINNYAEDMTARYSACGMIVYSDNDAMMEKFDTLARCIGSKVGEIPELFGYTIYVSSKPLDTSKIADLVVEKSCAISESQKAVFVSTEAQASVAPAVVATILTKLVEACKMEEIEDQVIQQENASLQQLMAASADAYGIDFNAILPSGMNSDEYLQRAFCMAMVAPGNSQSDAESEAGSSASMQVLCPETANYVETFSKALYYLKS